MIITPVCEHMPFLRHTRHKKIRTRPHRTSCYGNSDHLMEPKGVFGLAFLPLECDISNDRVPFSRIWRAEEMRQVGSINERRSRVAPFCVHRDIYTIPLPTRSQPFPLSHAQRTYSHSLSFK